MESQLHNSAILAFWRVEKTCTCVCGLPGSLCGMTGELGPYPPLDFTPQPLHPIPTLPMFSCPLQLDIRRRVPIRTQSPYFAWWR
jgi:hypothetical protein